MPLLGLSSSRYHIDQLFDRMDPDGAGAIQLCELSRLLGLNPVRGDVPDAASPERTGQT